MAGPPVMPPKLSYKSKAQIEQEEREQREREERERQERERERKEMERKAREAEALKAATRKRRDATLMRPPEAGPPPAEVAATTAPPPPPSPPGPVLFEEDEEGPAGLDLEAIEMLEAAEDWEAVEEEEVVAEAEAAPRRRPPRPPKSPDMRPVYAGFLLVGTGLVQFVYGVWAMVESPHVASGVWSPLVRWGAFSLGFSASFLGLLAVRGGLWSFRKERFDVVKIGAISASVCIWALWIPWVLGFAALLMVQRAKTEYYPYYDPRWDAPSWARPPRATEEARTAREDEEEEPVGEEWPIEPGAMEPPARDFLDDETTRDDKEAVGLQDAVLELGEGWEDEG